MRLHLGDPDVEDRRAARVEHLEEFVWRGDYQIPAPEIVAALLQEAGLARAGSVARAGQISRRV